MVGYLWWSFAWKKFGDEPLEKAPFVRCTVECYTDRAHFSFMRIKKYLEKIQKEVPVKKLEERFGRAVYLLDFRGLSTRRERFEWHVKFLELCYLVIPRKRVWDANTRSSDRKVTTYRLSFNKKGLENKEFDLIVRLEALEEEPAHA